MTSGIANVSMPPDWARTLVDQQAFEWEQSRLAHVWTFLGLASDVTNDGDWLRASLATRSVFVQRFGAELKGFENRCAHRFYPLRTADKGSGPIVCGFHHWRYDREGRALGIPLCNDLFGGAPRDLDARLTRIEIQTCGTFVFGRFPAPHATCTLEEFLGDSFPILAAMSQFQETPRSVTEDVEANWRLCFHISVEDYHLAAVHPNTIGKLGYLKRDNIGYFSIGDHSAYFGTNNPTAVKDMAAACRDGTWQSAHYRIFHIFPNFAVAHFHADGNYWHISVLQYVPLSKSRSRMRAWTYPAPFKSNHPWHERLLRPFTDPIRKRVVFHVMKKVLREDNEACEQLQTVASQIHSAPLLGRLEERIVWFETAYAKAMAGDGGDA